jgi:hypothetical protein
MEVRRVNNKWNNVDVSLQVANNIELLLPLNENYHEGHQYLMVDSCQGGGFFLDLLESTNGGRRTKFRGKFQEAEAVNKNKRMYPYSILDENIGRLQETITAGGLVGELDHPTDSIIHFANASHKITKLWWDGNVLMGEGEILGTPHGMILKALIDDDVRVGISSRGVGNGKVNEDGILVIGESYKLITFDAVADPSTFQAFQKEIVGNKRESYVPRNSDNNTKNVHSSIYNVRKEQVIACLGGIVKTQTNEIKARLNNNG